jgi:hypothetical protein
MDRSSDKYKPYYGSRSGPLVAVVQTFKGIVRRLIGFVLLTEDERLQAGISVPGQGRDEKADQ